MEALHEVVWICVGVRPADGARRRARSLRGVCAPRRASLPRHRRRSRRQRQRRPRSRLPRAGSWRKAPPLCSSTSSSPTRPPTSKRRWPRLKKRLPRPTSRSLKKLADGWQVLKVGETAGAGSPNVIYLVADQPRGSRFGVRPGQDHLRCASEAEADEIFNKLKDSCTNLQRWTLEKVIDMKAGG